MELPPELKLSHDEDYNTVGVGVGVGYNEQHPHQILHVRVQYTSHV